MHYDSVSDKWNEECGVFGIFDHALPIATYVYWGLFALQHRGQESAGIAVGNGKSIEVVKGMGLVTEVFKQVPAIDGFVGIGHVRYSTTGSNKACNIQPLQVQFLQGEMAVAHNGNLVNTLALRKELETQGAIFQTSMDSEVLVNLIARSQGESVEARIQEAAKRIEGAYSLVINTRDALIGVRDPHGFRPLCLGKTKTGGYILSSESCALDALHATFIRDVEPGEIVIIDDTGVRSTRLMADEAPKSLCVFEYIYFARSDSRIDGTPVYDARLEMGRELAREAKFDADIVVGVPDSGTTAAHGYARESGIPFAEGLIKNRYMGRTFIKPNQEQRELAVRMKLNPLPSVLAGKRVVLVDDSIVRGTTSGIIVKLLREAGAKEVYVCISSPPIAYSCFYGIDTSERKDLIATRMTVDEIREYIGADGLHYLSEEGLARAMNHVEGLCFTCFDGNYVTAVPAEGDKYALE